jgi:hypothetical protein
MRRWWLHDTPVYRPDDEDTQQHRVYRLERTIKGWYKDSVVDEANLIGLTADACKWFRVKTTPEIYIVHKKNNNIGWCVEDGIYLNTYRDGQNYATLLHELSHWLCDELYGLDTKEGHGPEWAEIYIELLDRYRFMPRWLSVQLFDSYGVQR